MIYKNQYKSFIGNIITLPHTVKDPGLFPSGIRIAQFPKRQKAGTACTLLPPIRSISLTEYKKTAGT